MKNYEAGTPSYFATPPVQLIYALHQSLKNITTSKPTLEERFAMHREASKKFKAFVTELGMGQVRGYVGLWHVSELLIRASYPARSHFLPRLVQTE